MNKIIVSIVLATILVLGINKITDVIFYVEKPEKSAYQVANVTTAASATGAETSSKDSVSEDIIGTDSTGVKEAVMMNKKMINIPNKSYRILDELYDENAKEKFLYTENSSDRILNHMEENV